MTIYTYNNKSDRREIYKTLTDQATHTNVHLKDDTNVTDPTLIFSQGSQLADSVNYIYIPSFNRYYFVNSKTMSQQRMYVECHVDVLESKRSQLLAQNCIVARSANKFNAYQVDSDVPQINSSEITVTRFGSSFLGESLILAVAGGTPTP